MVVQKQPQSLMIFHLHNYVPRWCDTIYISTQKYKLVSCLKYLQLFMTIIVLFAIF